MTAVAVATPLETMEQQQHPLREKNQRSSISPPPRELVIDNENDSDSDNSFSYDELQPPAPSKSNMSMSWHPRSMKEGRKIKSKMNSRHQRKYSSESISEDSAESLFYVDPFGNDCEDVEQLQERGRKIESQRKSRRNSLPPAGCMSEMHTASTAPSPSIVEEDRKKGRESWGEDDGTERHRRTPRRRSVAGGNPRRCKAVDPDSMADFNLSMSLHN
eukprot:CAMPEP_0113616144 /NCGR_PEP_ID=MMETSP0017_2-20120614/8084_1 /TAXON_ID=2856 /ORGANISM="Cylindrotheca closterium" /LENGTH=216 /DNA_ID=CAMNT_0000525441 /DNA_START=37 /DNA_END=687 /DNA_ORIENTATION=- /assembly_acc=CAM_ASM_000147